MQIVRLKHVVKVDNRMHPHTRRRTHVSRDHLAEEQEAVTLLE